MSVIRAEDKSDVERLIEGHIAAEESRVYRDQINCCAGAGLPLITSAINN